MVASVKVGRDAAHPVSPAQIDLELCLALIVSLRSCWRVRRWLGALFRQSSGCHELFLHRRLFLDLHLLVLFQILVRTERLEDFVELQNRILVKMIGAA